MTKRPFLSIWFGNFFEPFYSNFEATRQGLADCASLGFNSINLDSKAWEDFFARYRGKPDTASGWRYEVEIWRPERLMAILGSRMLEAQKRVGETAYAIELRQSGENSVLSTLSLSVSDGLTHVLRWVAWWNSTEPLPEDIGEDRVLVQLNTDFSNKGMASDELTAIVSA